MTEQRQPLRQRRPAEAADHPELAPDPSTLHREHGQEREQRRQRERREGEELSNRRRPEEPDADPQEAREQDEVREEREVDVVRARPADQPELDEQHQEAEEGEAHAIADSPHEAATLADVARARRGRTPAAASGSVTAWMAQDPSLGPRGEGWVALQLLGLALVFGVGLVAAPWPPGARPWLSCVAAVLVAGGALLFLFGVRHLGWVPHRLPDAP